MSSEYSKTSAALRLCRSQDQEWIGREREAVALPGTLEWAESHGIYLEKEADNDLQNEEK